MTELKLSMYAVSRTISDYGDLTAEERARLHNHLRCIREGDDLWLFDSPDAGWELMTRGGEGWINLKETGLANLLLQELSFNSRRLTAILGNPHGAWNLDAIAERDERVYGLSYQDSMSHRLRNS